MTTVTLSGSCLCGSVRYEISGDAGQFWHCHCGRCRKATGTGHATNILMKPDKVEWTAGNDLLKYYKVPDARRFATVFCTVCGSLMPRVAPDLSIAVVPAGTLDDDPGIHGHRGASSRTRRRRGPATTVICPATTPILAAIRLARAFSLYSGGDVGTSAKPWFFNDFLSRCAPVLCELAHGLLVANRRNSAHGSRTVIDRCCLRPVTTS